MLIDYYIPKIGYGFEHVVIADISVVSTRSGVSSSVRRAPPRTTPACGRASSATWSGASSTCSPPRSRSPRTGRRSSTSCSPSARRRSRCSYGGTTTSSRRPSTGPRSSARSRGRSGPSSGSTWCFAPRGCRSSAAAAATRG